MPFSPEEIASKKFSITSAEGCDPKEVEAFLSELALDYEKALHVHTAEDVIPNEVSNQTTELLRSAREWAEQHVIAAREEARAIERDAQKLVNDSIRRSKASDARAKKAARRRATSVISEATTEASALREQAERRAQRVAELAEKQPDRVSRRKNRLVDEVETVEKVVEYLRRDLVGAKKEPRVADEPVRVLVVSSNDREMAPMAAALLKEALADYGATGIEVTSAGITEEAGQPPDDQIRGFLHARGIDISAQRSRPLDAGEVLRADLVVAMNQSEREQIMDKIPEANAILLKGMQQVSLDGGRNGSLRERVAVLSAYGAKTGDGYDLVAPIGTWPRLYHQCVMEMEPGIDALASVLADSSSRLRNQGDVESIQEHADPTLFDWLAHYGALLVLLVLLGVAGAVVYIGLGARQFEASTLVVDTGRAFTARQLALVSQATFQSPAVVGPTMDELGIDVPVQEFLEESVDLRPVPDTNTLMVVGRSNSIDRAGAISEVAADAFVSASNARTDLTNFVIFGRSQGGPVQQNIAPAVAVVLGVTVGFWFGIAAAVLHYRLKRPVLAFARALKVSGADGVTIVNSRWSWLGVLQPKPPRTSPRSGELKPAHDEDTGIRQQQPIAWFGEGNGTRVVVAHPGTRERELELARLIPTGMEIHDPPRHIQLVWLR
jgi:protein-tyrosine-phosphatase/cell division septum initiation protein DivIVA